MCVSECFNLAPAVPERSENASFDLHASFTDFLDLSSLDFGGTQLQSESSHPVQCIHQNEITPPPPHTYRAKSRPLGSFRSGLGNRNNVYGNFYDKRDAHPTPDPR
ncbi:hypothetical protein CC2G_008977 [Coprinopsis cinerea AmutBmut pab1-1]|nr:hypothetical protein CC2G_008977 [Coprinopsis cinerea AmutBmut pab1-1]